MELDELERRLGPFVRAKYGDPAAQVSEVHRMPGHAGFAYGFTVESRGARESWFLRIPPPTPGDAYRVQDDDRLDLIANRAYDDPTRFWLIADANTELEARRLLEPGREIGVPPTR